MYIRLASAALLPVLLSVILYLLDTKTALFREREALKQILAGIVFGGAAVLGTEFGIPVNGAILNVRDAAPLCAGLIFGAPAGIIAGLIGGIERYVAVLWGARTYTRLACSISTALAGLIAAWMREKIFNRKLPPVVYALFIGVVVESMHMLMVFITNMNNVEYAFVTVKNCAPAMICLNGVSVFIAVLVIRLMCGSEKKRDPKLRRISQTMQRVLVISLSVGFVVTLAFIYVLQSRVTQTDTANLLKLNISDVEKDIIEASDASLLNVVRQIKADIEDDNMVTYADLKRLCEKHNVAEINIVEADGRIHLSNIAEFIGFDMSSGEQAAEFLALINDSDTCVQEYQPMSYDSSTMRKYAGTRYKDGFIQVGYDAEQFGNDLSLRVEEAVKNRHIGKDGTMYAADNAGELLNGADASISDFLVNGALPEEMKVYRIVTDGAEYDAMFSSVEGYSLIAVLPRTETLMSRDLSVHIIFLMEVIVFAELFVLMYLLIKKLIVDNIEKINRSLAKITGGNLDEKVDVRSSYEFASLSDDINTTVVTLKRYISEAEERIASELEFARNIQTSSLPSVFPAYPNRPEFDIYAHMDAAKEVGGDFYDFYMLGEDRLVFLIADVSGKGIPAAMFMMRAKTLIKALVEGGTEPDEAFTEANAGLCENNGANMFVTAWMGILELKTGRVRFVNAGHNRPVVIRADGAAEYLNMRPGFVLAGMEGVHYRCFEMQLSEGDRLFLYTDGVTEAVNPKEELYGDDRLLSVITGSAGLSPEKLCGFVRRDVDSFADGAEQADDITMLSVLYNGHKE